MRDDTTGGRLTRRVVLGMAAAVPAVLLPAVTAEARRRPVGSYPPGLTIGPFASVVTGMPGPVPNGLRLHLTLAPVAKEDNGTFEFFKLLAPDVGELTTFNPSGITVGPAGTMATLDVGPVTAGELPASLSVHLYFGFYGSDSYPDLSVIAPLKLVPLGVFERLNTHRPPKPPNNGPSA
jgi:hypothetical protein